jgi:hypothetical protein
MPTRSLRTPQLATTTRVLAHRAFLPPQGQVVYRTENGECRPFVFEGRSDAKPPTVARNFEVYDPLDFLAACPP